MAVDIRRWRARKSKPCHPIRMCGFAAIIKSNDDRSPASPVAQRMIGVLTHRGPDDVGVFGDERVGLGFRRLAILDLASTGHQPLASPDGRYVLVFNGEIYNYVELRHELRALGHTFISSGDSEVLLRAYMQWGRACLPRLNGMWAFLVYDTRRGVVFGARDRFGVKPLFRCRTPGAILFASEIKAIRASGLARATPNMRLTAEFLCRGNLASIDKGTETFFNEIDEVPAGTAFEVRRDGHIEEWSYWSLDDLSTDRVENPAEEFAALFEDAVRLRMRSDVPVGVSLSGGLDSTAISCAMARMHATALEGGATPINAFAFMDGEFDESKYIDATVRQTRVALNEVRLDGRDVWNRIERVLWHHDEPIHSATAIISYEIYRQAAASGIKVMLCGQGADEALAGYGSYFEDTWATQIRRGRIGGAWRNIRDFAALHGGAPRALFRGALARVIKSNLRWIPHYRAIAARRRVERQRHALRWFSRDLWAYLPFAPDAIGDGTLDGVLRHSVRAAPLPLYLRLEDRNSMANSVEARTPFLDYRLIALAARLSLDWKMRGGLNKYVLREAMRGRIPESVRTRVDKMGFPTPDNRWFRHELYEPLQDVLSTQGVRDRGLYDVGAIRKDLERHRRGELNVGRLLFNVVQIEQWIAAANAPQTPLAPRATDVGASLAPVLPTASRESIGEIATR
jgi:asparagine synthase (glutamine-hydrolysing)